MFPLFQIISEWTGQELTQCSLYGIRVYKGGAILAPHVGKCLFVQLICYAFWLPFCFLTLTRRIDYCVLLQTDFRLLVPRLSMWHRMSMNRGRLKCTDMMARVSRGCRTEPLSSLYLDAADKFICSFCFLQLPT